MAPSRSRQQYDDLDDSEEERQLQEAIRMSMMEEQPSPDSPTTGSISSKKRSADRDVSPPALKRSRVETITDSQKSAPTIAFPNGALRITRTPGRQGQKNCINLGDLIHKDHLLSACVYSFFIARNELFGHLPLSMSSDDVPVSRPPPPHYVNLPRHLREGKVDSGGTKNSLMGV